jgi:hypothetical protein
MPKQKESTEQERIRHIEQMKQQLAAHIDSPENFWMSESLSLEVQEKFLESILSMESAEERPLFDILERKGVRIPQAAKLDDAQLTAKLWEVINAMARLGHYLESTDHLSDRELYELLWTDILRQPTPISSDPDCACHIDILGGCSEEDLQLNLKYYADEDERLDWEEQFPEDPIPPHEPLPFDRDRHLPVRTTRQQQQ